MQEQPYESPVEALARRPRVALALACVRAVVRLGSRPRKVLDARCSDGLVALTIARRFPFATVIGQDVDPVGIARARLVRPSSRVEFEVSDSLRLRHFDLDVATVCLDLCDPTRAFPLLVSLRNALGRDGVVIAAVRGSDEILDELAAAAGFSRISRRAAPRAAALFQLQR
jgi:trans-aconitate methyltransferase